MKKWKLVIAVSALFVGLGIVAVAQTADPGTQEDPVVTKSYVDNAISAISTEGASVFVVVEVAAGKIMTAGAGTELIVRTGTAKAIDNGSNGISDLTSGKDLTSGQLVENNHLILIPRNDGRGISAETILWVMVKGSYELK